VLTVDELAAARTAAERAGVSVDSVIVGAWALLASQYSGRTDVLFCVGHDEKTGEKADEKTVVPTRIWLGAEQKTPAFLRRVCADLRAGRQNAGPALDDLARFADLPDGAPLADTVIWVDRDDTAEYPIQVRARTSGEPELAIDYDETYLADAAAEQVLRHFRQALAALASGSDAKIGSLTVLPGRELKQQLYGWNDTDHAVTGPACIHELFEWQAARSPDAVAVVQPGRTLTYAELDRAANLLAARLTAAGVGPGEFVALHLERTVHIVVALLGVLKSGAAYAPIEPSLPADRVRDLLAGLSARVAVTSPALVPGLLELLPGLPALREVLWLADEDQPPAIEQRERARRLGVGLDWALAAPPPTPPTPPTPPAPPPTPRPASQHDLAYVIFTSGSTGTPKGVLVSHAPVVNLIRWANDTFQIGSADRVLFVTALGFDLSVYDVFGLLAAGGSIRVATDEEVRDPARLLSVLDTEPITFWDSAPAAMQQLEPLFALRPPTDTLRLVFLSGDWVPLTLPDSTRSAFPNAEVVALGGATEAAIWSNFHRVSEVDPAWVSIPYGRPIRNARYYILDAGLRPVPVGVAGDLYIGGDCLALGYHGAPGLTAAKFIPDPFDERPGRRLYRTGDRARFWPDGTIEFLGRADGQVKIRGYRIELGEIEAMLSARPGVASAIASVRPVAGSPQLVGYVVPARGQAPDVAALRSHLAERLPEYMVPTRVLVLDTIPVTANGKLDRNALPVPDPRSSGGESAAPRTATEQAVAAIWADVLDLPTVGVDDDFFELGGHSLVATRVIARIQVLLDVNIPLRELFVNSQLAQFCAVVERALFGNGGEECQEGLGR